MSTVVFFDNTDVSLLPQADYFAGYLDGIFANIAVIHAKYPAAGILTIDVLGTRVADCLDVEPGDASNTRVVPWFKAALSGGITKPCIYSSVSNIDTLVNLFNSAGIPRTAYRLWSAHYGSGSHICGPATCRETQTACDATQFTDTADNRSLDESVALSNFFTAVTPPAPVGNPTLSLNDTGSAVRTLQERLNAWHANPEVKVDGNFGTGTQTAVRDFQAAEHLAVDGVTGPATWTALLKTPPVTGFSAPGRLVIGKRWVASWEAPVNVDGHSPTGYHVHLMKNGEVIQTNDVTIPEATYESLSGSYEIEVQANGGPGTPSIARIDFVA